MSVKNERRNSEPVVTVTRTKTRKKFMTCTGKRIVSCDCRIAEKLRFRNASSIKPRVPKRTVIPYDKKSLRQKFQHPKIYGNTKKKTLSENSSQHFAGYREYLDVIRYRDLTGFCLEIILLHFNELVEPNINSKPNWRIAFKAKDRVQSSARLQTIFLQMATFRLFFAFALFIRSSIMIDKPFWLSIKVECNVWKSNQMKTAIFWLDIEKSSAKCIIDHDHYSTELVVISPCTVRWQRAGDQLRG